MPGWELVGESEREMVDSIFGDGGGVAFAHGFAALRDAYHVRALESEVAEWAGVTHCQAVSSGSAGLFCALKAAGVGPGDEVITSCFTFVATVEAILLAGAFPVCVDIDKSLNMDLEAAREALSSRTKAVIPVHMCGKALDVNALITVVTRENGTRPVIIEDACQAMGARTVDDRLAGTVGDIGVYSLDAGKVIQCGEGGLVITNSLELYERVRAVHDHGHTYDNPDRAAESPRMVGFNFRMTELQAAYARAQLKRLPGILETQRGNLAQLLDLPNGENIQDAGDSLVLFFESREYVQRLAPILRQRKIGTKNVPDALNWHFARNWEHIFPDASFRWPRSADILSRTVVIPIPATSQGPSWRDSLYLVLAQAQLAEVPE